MHGTPQKRDGTRYKLKSLANMIAQIVEKNDQAVYRFLEILTTSVRWAVLLSPIWLGLLAPKVTVFMLTFFAVFWVYLAIRHSMGMIIGYLRYKKEMKVDWYEECQKLDFKTLPDKETLPPSLKITKHFILIPAYSEPYEIFKETLDALFKQTFPTEQVTLVFTIEEKYSERVKENIIKAIGDRLNKLERLMIYVHPAGIPGEAIGVAGANRTWGAKHAIEDLKKENVDLRNYIFTTMDSDHALNPQFLSRLTHLFLTNDKRDNKFYSSAVSLFDNNYWRVPTLMRIEATSILMGGLSDWVVSHKGLKDTFSNYSTSLQTLIDANYWDVKVGIDDTVFFWRAFSARNGDFIGVCHYIPYSADAVEGKSYWGSYKSLYKQLVRWGWGTVSVPISLREFLKNKKIPFRHKLLWTLEHIKKYTFLVNVVFLITFGFSIVSIVNPYIKQTSYAYSLPKIMSVILTIPLIFFIPATILKLKIVRPMPENWPLWKKTFSLLEGPMVLINLLTFSFFPFLEAQTRMLFGKKMKDLYHTPKVR